MAGWLISFCLLLVCLSWFLLFALYFFYVCDWMLSVWKAPKQSILAQFTSVIASSHSTLIQLSMSLWSSCESKSTSLHIRWYFIHFLPSSWRLRCQELWQFLGACQLSQATLQYSVFENYISALHPGRESCWSVSKKMVFLCHYCVYDIIDGAFQKEYVHPYLGKIPILTIYCNIFQRGWNHQLVL